MKEIMSTEDMEHVQQDRDISDIMHKRDAEYQQKIDDQIKAEAAQYNLHMKRVRSLFHKASHVSIFLMGVGVAFMISTFMDSNIYGLLGSTVITGFASYLGRMFSTMSKKKGDV